MIRPNGRNQAEHSSTEQAPEDEPSTNEAQEWRPLMDSYFYGEPMTDGECLIPLRGISSCRSTALAQTVANAYGLVSNLDTSNSMITMTTDTSAIANVMMRLIQTGQIQLPGARDPDDDGSAGVPARV